jgi:hypothetical protein
LRDRKQTVGLNADNSEQGFNKVQDAVHKVYEKIVRGGHQEGLANLAIQAPLHLTMEEIAKIENGG